MKIILLASFMVWSALAYSAYHIDHQDGETLFDINSSAGNNLDISDTDGMVEYPGGE